MDVDALLNIEKRTGIKNSDIDDFLEKASAVQAAIQGMKDGTVDPDKVKIKGILTEEEKAAKEAERQEQKRIQDEKREQLRLKRKAEEKERWWAGADLFRKDKDVQAEDEARGVIRDEDTAASSGSSVKARYDFDYSRWDTWTPDDDATREEAAEKEAQLDKLRNVEFEKNNPEFCDNFVNDMKERQKKEDKKANSANVMRLKGNNEFKRKDYATALVHYMDALKVLPYEPKTLMNIAQVNIKQKKHDDALEFIERVLYLDAKHIKALSRKAHVLSEEGRVADALEACSKALDLDPENKDLIKQRNELRAIVREEDEEKKVTQLAQEAEKKITERSKAVKEAKPAVAGSASQIPNSADELDRLRNMSMDELTKALEETIGAVTSGGGVATEGAFGTFNSVLNALKEGRVVSTAPDAPTGMPVLPNMPKSFNVFDALSEIMEMDAKMRVYFRTSGALALCSACLRNMLLKLVPELGTNGDIRPGEWTGEGKDPSDEHASIALVNAIFMALSVACGGERAIKMVLLEDTCLRAAQRVVVAMGTSERIGEIRYANVIDSDTGALVGALPGALRLVEQCSKGNEAIKVMEVVCKDKELLIGLGKMLGELSTQLPSAPTKTEGFKALLALGDSMCEVAGVVVGSAAGQKHAVQYGGGGLVVCGLGALLSSLRAVGDVGMGLVGVALSTLTECSHVSELQAFFSVPLPGSDADDDVSTRCTATTILGVANDICKTTGIVGAHSGPIKVSVVQRSQLECALGLLMNACLDKDAGKDSVRGILAANGAVELSLKAASTCVTVGILQVQNKGTTASAPAPGGRLFVGLLARLASVESVQRALALPGPFRVLCKMVAKVEEALGDDAAPNADLEATFGHFVTILAYLAKYATEIRAVAAEEGLLATLLGAFPEPRRELGSITPESVTKTPMRPVNALLVGNAAMCLRAFADDAAVGRPIFTSTKHSAVEKLICSMATCTNVTVRKNIATVLAKACVHPGVKEKMVEFRGMQIIRELNSQGQI